LDKSFSPGKEMDGRILSTRGGNSWVNSFPQGRKNMGENPLHKGKEIYKKILFHQYEEIYKIILFHQGEEI